MNKYKKVVLGTTTALMIGMSSYSFAVTGIINGTGVRVRSNPDTEASIITNLYKDNKVEVIEKSGDWYKIKYDGKEGYTHKDYIKVEGEVAETNNNEQQENSKISASVNVYIMPVITSNIVNVLEKDKEINVEKTVGKWSYITCGDIKGWVRSSKINKQQETKPEEKPQQPQEENKPEETKPVYEEKLGYINVELANMREKASTDSNVVMRLSLNTEIRVVGEENDWYKVIVQEKEGYILNTLISDKKTEVTNRGSQTQRPEVVETEVAVEEKVETVIKTSYVSVSAANVREKATTASKVLTTVGKRTAVSVLGEEGDFYKVKLNNKVGYISKSLLVDDKNQIKEETVNNTTSNVTTNTSNNTGNTSAGQKVIDFAQKYLGYKYVYGGTTPSGFDCSGFVYYVFNSCGYNISRSCSVQAKTGSAVSKSNLQAGDVIFFNNGSGGSIGHVGIYIGGGKFIHAANPKRGVVIDTINSGYYYTYYYSARRFV